MNSGASPAEHMIRNLVSCELAYINTSHPQFVGGNRAIAQVLSRRGSGNESGDDDAVPAHRPVRGPSRAAPRAHPVPAGSPNGLAAAAKLGAGARGVQPELFRPEDLLSAKEKIAEDEEQRGSPGGQQNQNQGQGSSEDNEAPKGWFSNWFSRSGSQGESLEDGGDGSSPSAPMLQRPPPTLKVPKAASDQEGVQVEVTRVLVDSYFDIVRKNLQDAVPKAVMHFLVGATRRSLQQHLIRTLYREDLLGELMAEREDVAVRRHQCQDSLRALRAAIKTLEILPGELTGRVNASGARWNFKHMMQAIDDPVGGSTEGNGRSSGGGGGAAAGGGSRSSSPLKNGMSRERSSKPSQQRPSAATVAAHKAAMSAVSMLGGSGGSGGGRNERVAVYDVK